MGIWKNGEEWEFPLLADTDGNTINASDGGIIYAEGKYHWYGQALRDLPYAPNGAEGGQTTRVGVVMYASDDLCHWQYEGVILACSQDPKSELYAPMRFERPKILYNEKTKEYVLWCHYLAYPGNHGVEIVGGEAGVAVCDKVNGRYRWMGHFRPIDSRGAVRDCTLYKDKDGSAYFIDDRDESRSLSEQDRCLHIVKLTEDYRSATIEYRRIDGAWHREAPALFYRDGYYYMITSGLTGWAYNGAKYFRAESLMGEWTDMGDPCVGDVEQTTFCSQSTGVFERVDKRGAFIHMAERHNTENFLHSSYVWLPVEFEGERLSLSYKKEWEL
ncbi:MAG: family 43 glycosylhydrolase [Clostridia bacterium]|nr:family 43 glycosylhydrolase [Clostridia bacterium]